MKKMILVIIAFAAGHALSAQTNYLYKLQTDASGTREVVPRAIPASSQTNYPVFTVTTGESKTEWWYSGYKVNDNRITYVYYSMQPYYLLRNREFYYNVALPVMNTYVPETGITTAINSYGASLYSITMIRASNNEMVYQVCLLENGIIRTVWMNAESIVFTSLDKMRAGDLKDKMNQEK